MNQTPHPSGQTPVGSAAPVPKPPGGSDPHPLSPLPPASGVPHAGTGWYASGASDSGTRASVAAQELGADKLLLAASRVTYDGRSVPSLGGIPILAKLGQGGMGAVYFGIHPRLHKEVAVKVLPFLLAEQQPDLVQRFFREARIAARVQSPHLVGVMDVNEENGLFFLVMEYVHGETGKKYLQRILDMGKPGLEETVALEICVAAARGLSVAHAQSIVHRDIKPDNILIPWTRDGDRLQFDAAKVSDLGLARGEDLHQSLTGTQSAMGTPGYMSPEQAMDAHSAGVGADVFSLGATLYALLCGRAPFTGASVTKVIFDTVQAPHVPLQKFRPDVSPNTLALIDRCLRKNPAERFGGGAELLAALQSCRGVLGEPEPTIRGRLPGSSDGLPQVTPVTPMPAPVLPGAPATPSAPFAPFGTPVPAPGSAAPGMPLPAAYTPPPSSPSTLNPAQAAPAPPSAPAYAAPAAAPAPGSVPALPPPPPPRRSGAWMALAALVLLGAGGYFGWQHLEQKHREERAQQRRDEIAAAVDAAARVKTGGEDALRSAVAALQRVEEKFKDEPEADLSALRALKADYETAVAQAGADRDLEKVLANENDPAQLPQVLADLGELARRMKDARGLDVSRLEDARRRLQKRSENLDQRRARYQELLEKAETAAKTDPEAALAALGEAERLGKADPKEGWPDLIAPAARRIEAVRGMAGDTRDRLAKKLAEERKAKEEQERREKFKRDYALAVNAYQDRNYVLAATTLKEALEALGELEHLDKDTARNLLETVQLQIEKTTQYAAALKEGEAALEQRDFAAAKQALKRAADLWPDAPQKDRVSDGLKKAEAGLDAQARNQDFAAARKLLDRESWAEAAKAYAALIEREPQSVEAREGLAAARYGGHLKAGADHLAGARWAEAEQAFNDALKERANDPKARRGVADARYGNFMAEGKRAMEARNWKQALSSFKNALAARPADPDADRSSQVAGRHIASESYAAAMTEGRQLLEAGRAKEAADAFRRALDAMPGDREAQAALAATSSVKMTLQAGDNWADSGVRLKAGDRFKVAASGAWKAFALGPRVDPSGKGGTPNGRVLNRDEQGHAFFAETLIGRVMGKQPPPPKPGGIFAPPPPAGPPPFYVGEGGVFTANSDGMLQFRMNEENPLLANPLADNQGAVTITISVVPGDLLPGNEEKGRLGVAVQALTAEIAEPRGLKAAPGAFVASVQADSPAAAAGFQEGDLIVRFDGKQIAAPQDLVDASSKVPDGQYKVEIVRKGAPLVLSLRLGVAPAPPAGGVQAAFGPYETLGTFGVYANKQSQGIPLDRRGKVIPVRTDLDKEQYEEALKDRRGYATVEKGTKVRIEYSGAWFSGPGGEWVGADGRHADGKESLKQFRAFRGANDEYNIAILVVYVSEKDKNETADFTRIAEAGQVWGVGNKNEPLEFVMPVTGTLRFQQNRDGFYDVTQGALNVTVKLAKQKP
ncbi:MAG: protein kinase [Planctomycetota bacterium]|nr:protein kinase [Planctomycetota bacterium]